MFIFLGMFLIAINVDIKEMYRRVWSGANKGARKLEISAKNNRGGMIGKVIAYTELMIQKSNIRLYVAYNVWCHFFICSVFAVVAYDWIIQFLNKFISLAFAIVVLLVPYMLLQIISDFIESKEKMNAINFLIILKNFFRSGKNDVFEAFKKTSYYLSEPLKSYVDVLVYEYEHRINPITCLQNFKEKLGTPELKLYIENLSICYVQGGDVVGLTDTFIEDIQGLDEEDDKQNTEDRILNYGLYILLFFNFGIIYWIMNSTYKMDVMNSLWGQFVFVMDMFTSIYIIYMTLEKR